MVILKNHLRLLFIYKSQLLIFWLYTIMQSINNKFLVFKNDQNLQHHFELHSRELKAIFGSMLIDFYRKRKNIFSIFYSATCIFRRRSCHKCREPKILKYFKTGLFLNLLSVIYGFLTPKNLPIPNFKMKGWLEHGYYRKRKFKIADFTLEHPFRLNFQISITSKPKELRADIFRDWSFKHYLQKVKKWTKSESNGVMPWMIWHGITLRLDYFVYTNSTYIS